MSLYDWKEARADIPRGVSFHALIMAATIKADTENLEALRREFPNTVAEAEARYNAPGGRLEGEK